MFKQKFKVRIFILDPIRCVRWSPSGDQLASASDDKTVKLLNFNTGKVLYTGNTTDECKLSIPKYMIAIQKSSRRRLFSMLHLDKSDTKGPREQELLSRARAKQHTSDNDSVNYVK